MSPEFFFRRTDMTSGTAVYLAALGAYVPSVDAVIGAVDFVLGLAALVFIAYSVRRRNRRSAGGDDHT